MHRAVWLTTLSLTGMVGSANATICDTPSYDELFAEADRVFVTRLDEIEAASGPDSTYWLSFEVTETLKGSNQSDVLLAVKLPPQQDPNNAYNLGFNYLMFLRKGQTQIRECDPIWIFHRDSFKWYMDFRESRESNNDT